ncbi:putative N-terminal acetyltransferase complex subunit NARG1 [Neospora caninum Liverpool]|uniref:N-terminal acetyltransferase complex subunit NARG1, putative n=1 Tax=Neospora caninum (strain Liverpool) TaxID=572307 RepID=F0VK47_NEOCL|nr:putative N-terminal acetyltransferase complex subunit NARG1 [Neospora caninum Liverpool]CBZ54448.1 putative N-terminal acetyltransferase complex subunit NARG1 [Neospora caninum Liverpool]CEL69158.1 TPA: N-terminal acetyltransferase complex subunit NARG1, putative [Neospora caninum Liverpool]|eukprot:XP_003884478.1 putative N-terminal acetyltransferase complex subunit NARG1 [Neospora caninum Liverpool]
MSKSRTGTSGTNALPSKEQSIFKNLVYLYEHKHFKKAIKQADVILKKCPDHGETLSMKGLVLSNMRPENKEEAYELAKRGLRCDLKNYVCWHVLGLIYRADKDYFEAAKCFTQAVRLSPGNFQILRDLSNLQIHERNLEGFRETRRQILATRSQFIREWTAFALANHLCGSLDVAHDLLSEVEKQFEDAKDMDSFDKSEIILYSASILEQAGRFEDCMKYLKEREERITDKMSMLEMQGRLALHCGQREEGRKVYSALFKRNMDNDVYALCLLACHDDPELARLCKLPIRDSAHDGAAGRGACVELLPGCLASTGEGRAGWLPGAENRKARQRLGLLDPNVIPFTGWKRRRNSTPSPLFVVTRVPTDAEQDRLIHFFDGLKSEYGKVCSLPSFLVLSFLTGDRFQSRLDAFLRPALRKGVVSLFSSLRRLYTPDRIPLITALLESYVYHLEQDVSTFGPAGGSLVENGIHSSRWEKREDEAANPVDSFLENAASSDNKEREGEMPMCLLYSYMLLAQHYDFLGRTDKALAVVDKAIKHTPTLADLYLVKGRIYKHAGAYKEACDWHEIARSLDLADRFLNTKACCYLLRVNRAEEAETVAKLFSRQSDADGLHSMQCMWFEQKTGKCHLRNNSIGPALYEFNAVLKHFRDIREDQFDFHPYCLRKFAYRAYISFLRMQNKLTSHLFFRRAARQYVRTFLALHDGELDLEKARARAAEAHAVEQKAEGKKKKNRSAAQTNNGAATTDAGSKDSSGARVLEAEPLEAASQVVEQLLDASAADQQTHVLHYHVAARKKKTLAMLLAVVRLWRLAEKDRLTPRLVPLLLHFCRTASLDDLPYLEMAKEALAEIFGSAPENTAALRATGDAYWQSVVGACQRNPWNFRLRRAAVEAHAFTQQPITPDLPFLAFQPFPAGVSEDALRLQPDMPTLRECEKLLEVLSKHASAKPAAEALKAICKQRFALAENFS